jgi:hypothetical protein
VPNLAANSLRRISLRMKLIGERRAPRPVVFGPAKASRTGFFGDELDGSRNCLRTTCSHDQNSLYVAGRWRFARIR